MENKYNFGKIYKIVDNTTNKSYIGSTCESLLSKRLAQHTSAYKRYLQGLIDFNTCYKVLENNNYSIVLLELVNCNCRDELLQRERHFIETTENIVNKNKPCRTQKQYYQDNKERIINNIKINRRNNVEYYKQYQKDYRQRKKESIEPIIVNF